MLLASPLGVAVRGGAVLRLGDLSLSASSVAEDASVGAVVGAIQGARDGSTVTLEDDAGGLFALDGNNIEVGAALDYETATSHNITLRETNAAYPNSPKDTVIAISVTDVDDTAPTITSSNTASIAENTVLAHSLTANESVTWSIIGGADQALFELSGSTLRWASNGTQDYEDPADADTDNDYVVQVRATDAATNTADQTITVTVTDQDEIPTAFSFTDITDATLSTEYTSNTITVAGLGSGVSVPVSITGGTYSKNGAGYTSSAGTAVNGDQFSVRHTSSGSNSTATDTVLTIGGGSDTYTTTTVAGVTLGNELIQTPDFSSSTGWTLFSAAPPTISGGKLRGDSGDIGIARCTALETITAGTYRVTYTIDSISVGSVNTSVSNSAGTPRLAPGTYSQDIVVSSVPNQFIAFSFSDTDAVVDDVSCKRHI